MIAAQIVERQLRPGFKLQDYWKSVAGREQAQRGRGVTIQMTMVGKYQLYQSMPAI